MNMFVSVDLSVDGFTILHSSVFVRVCSFLTRYWFCGPIKTIWSLLEHKQSACGADAVPPHQIVCVALFNGLSEVLNARFVGIVEVELSIYWPVFFSCVA